jgi:GT2 family glycosyltransferase
MRRPHVSAIIVTLDEGHQLRRTVENLEAALSDPHEIIVVDDGSADGSLDFLQGGRAGVTVLRSEQIGVARARNLGAHAARGEVLAFCDAHIAMEPGCWEPLIELLQSPKVGAVNPAVCDYTDRTRIGSGMKFKRFDLGTEWLSAAQPRPVPLLAWACGVIRRELFEATGGFDAGMIRWGSIDNEMSVRLWLEGYELWVVPHVRVAHVFRDKRPYPMGWPAALHNRLRLALVHFEAPDRALVVDALRSHDSFSEALALSNDGDVTARRRALADRKVHDGTWFIDTFGPSRVGA